MNEHQFQQFIAERPALRLSILAEELGIDQVNLYKNHQGSLLLLYNKPPDHPQHAK